MKAGEGIGVAWGKGESSFHYTGYIDIDMKMEMMVGIKGER